MSSQGEEEGGRGNLTPLVNPRFLVYKDMAHIQNLSTLNFQTIQIDRFEDDTMYIHRHIDRYIHIYQESNRGEMTWGCNRLEHPN